jgi:hypothetical protein
MVISGNATTIWNTDGAINFTYTGTGRVELSYSGATGTRAIYHGINGGTEANSPNFYVIAGTDIVNFSGTGRKFGTIDFTGFGAGTGNIGSTQTVYGNLVLVTGMTIPSTTTGITFGSTSGTKTITTAGITLDMPLIFDGIGGSWSLQDALTLSSTRSLSLVSGTLYSSALDINIGSLTISGTNAKGTNLSGGSIYLNGTGTVLNATGSGFSMLSTDQLVLQTAGSQTFAGGSLSYGTLIINSTGTKTISGNNTFYNIVNTTNPVTINFTAGSTNSFYNWNVNGASGSLATLRSTVSGTQYTLAKL